MKVKFGSEELYGLSPEPSEAKDALFIPDELYLRWERLCTEFSKLQIEFERIVENEGSNR